MPWLAVLYPLFPVFSFFLLALPFLLLFYSFTITFLFLLWELGYDARLFFPNLDRKVHLNLRPLFFLPSSDGVMWSFFVLVVVMFCFSQNQRMFCVLCFFGFVLSRCLEELGN